MAKIAPKIKDGGIGTTLLALTTVNKEHPKLQCTDLLNLTQADQVIFMHQQFVTAGADLITSNTFCCDRDSLAGSGQEDHIQELSQRGAMLARQGAGPNSLILGSLGPGWKLPSRDKINIRDLERAYQERCLGLLKGGADILWIETVQDPRQAEAAISGALSAQTVLKQACPLAILITCSEDGLKTGPFSSLDVLKELNHLPVDILGINCSFRPQSLRIPLNWLREHSPKKLAACPNAGDPNQVLSPERFTSEMLSLWHDFQPEIIGGCCGVGPQYIQALNSGLKNSLD